MCYLNEEYHPVSTQVFERVCNHNQCTKKRPADQYFPPFLFLNVQKNPTLFFLSTFQISQLLAGFPLQISVKLLQYFINVDKNLF